MSKKISVETRFERLLFASRWLMAPMYLGLVIALGMLMINFVQQLIYYVPKVMTMTSEEMILVCLTLIDLSLAANLLLIVIFSGYENFVSKIDIGEDGERPGWMGTVDFSQLKMKLIASIVAISAIHLLKRFMEIGETDFTPLMNDPVLFWLVIIHLTFVVSGVLLALMDWLAARSGKH